MPRWPQPLEDKVDHKDKEPRGLSILSRGRDCMWCVGLWDTGCYFFLDVAGYFLREPEMKFRTQDWDPPPWKRRDGGGQNQYADLS